jgi:hypothetical protein
MSRVAGDDGSGFDELDAEFEAAESEAAKAGNGSEP